MADEQPWAIREVWQLAVAAHAGADELSDAGKRTMAQIMAVPYRRRGDRLAAVICQLAHTVNQLVEVNAILQERDVDEVYEALQATAEGQALGLEELASRPRL